jgi:hypothetical protein
MNESERRIESAWRWGVHEDNLFDSRLQVFLTAHAILIMAAGFAVQKEYPSRAFLLLLSGLGGVLGVVWLLVQWQSCRIVERIEEDLLRDPLFEETFSRLESSRLFRVPRNKLMTWVLPPVVLLWWLAFSLFALAGAFDGPVG